MEEEWRPVEGFPNYEVSNMGRVKRKAMWTRAKRDGKVYERYLHEKILKQWVDKTKKLAQVYLVGEAGKGIKRSVAWIVIKAFLHVPEGGKFMAWNKDGDITNNRVDNLELVGIRNYGKAGGRRQAVKKRQTGKKRHSGRQRFQDPDGYWRLLAEILRQTVKDLRGKSKTQKEQAHDFVYGKWFATLTAIDPDEFCAWATKKGISTYSYLGTGKEKKHVGSNVKSGQRREVRVSGL